MKNFYINPGDLRTKIRILCYIKPPGGDDFTKGSWIDIGNKSVSDPPKYFYCAWYPLNDSEMWVAYSEQVIDAANVIIRYNPKVTSKCRVIKDENIYSIIGPNDPTQRKQFLKFKVKGAVNT